MAPADPAAEALARYYDIDLAGEQDDVALYVALAARIGGPVLELAAGTGRIAVPLALAGHAVTGVDRDPQMLARAERRWADGRRAAGDGGSLALVEADILSLRLEERFGLAILALNTLLMLSGRDAQLAAVETMGRHLRPDGRAVIDVWLPAPDDLVAYDGRLVADWLGVDPETGESVAKLTTARYEPATATATVDTIFDAWPTGGGPMRRLARRDELHFLSAPELGRLLAQAGLAVESLGGDHEMTPFGPGSERIVVVCGLL